jgi:hypothetical protein
LRFEKRKCALAWKLEMAWDKAQGIDCGNIMTVSVFRQILQTGQDPNTL